MDELRVCKGQSIPGPRDGRRGPLLHGVPAEQLEPATQGFDSPREDERRGAHEDQVGSAPEVAGSERVAHRCVVVPGGLEDLTRSLMQSLRFDRIEDFEAPPEHLREQRVESIPLALVVERHQEDVARVVEIAQCESAVVVVEERVEQGSAHGVEHRRSLQEGDGLVG